MEKRIKNYLAWMESKNPADMTEQEKIALRADMLVQIGFFQHERLVHLIVTVTFAGLALLSVLGCLAWPGILTSILAGLFLLLLIPYIRHYYILENGVQKLYGYYDKMIKES